jgi:AcrR family transcriptional regulator
MKRRAPEAVNGKQRLVQAALHLCAGERSFSSLGLREIAREAGLNPNTFYRHFRDLDDLGLAIIAEITDDLRAALREIRRGATDATDAARRTVDYYFEFVRRHPQAFVIGSRELHGDSAAMRRALRQVLADQAADMAQDIRVAGLAPGLDDATLADVTRMIVYQMHWLTLEYLEHPKRRTAIAEHAVRFIVMLTAGALALHATP